MPETTPTIASAVLAVVAALDAAVTADPYGREAVSRRNAAQKTRTIADFRAAMDAAQAAAAAGAIAKPRYQEVKGDVNRALEEAWLAIGGSYTDYPQLHTLAGKRKRASDPTNRHDALLIAAAPIGELFTQLKPMVVKRQPKPVEDVRAKYLAPRAGQTAIAQVQAALVGITEAAYTDLRAQILDHARVVVALFETLRTAKIAAGHEPPTPYDVFLRDQTSPDHDSYRIVTLVSDGDGVVGDDKETRLAAHATEVAQAIRDDFVIKNLMKLDSIIDMKGGFAGVDVLDRRLSLGSLQGRLRLRFKDGAAFTVQNSVVWGTSIYGRPFRRFPLTFHDVRLPSGAQMARPSEERMNLVFVRSG